MAFLKICIFAIVVEVFWRVYFITNTSIVCEGHKAYSDARAVIENLPQASRPYTSVNAYNIEKVKETVTENQRVGITEIPENLNISFGSTQHISVNVLGTALAQRSNFRNGPGHPTSQRHLPKRPTDPPPTEEGYEPTDECPEANGFFPDLEQCDKYHSCYEGKSTERLCADGMVFNDYSPLEEKCDLPYNIDCSKRSKLQTPQPSQHCPRKNGYFGHEEKGVCDKFYYCVDGQFNMITCPVGLVFNPKTGICTWPDEVGVKGCNSQDIFEFECPKVNESVAVTHPRYADPDDCQYFYVCVNGEIPRRNGCKLGQVFDEEKKHCDWSRNVPECADWYKDRLTDAELEELENPKPKTKKPQRTRGPSRRKPAKAAQVEEEIEEE